MSIRNFERPFNRQVVTMPSAGVIKCVCGARAGYRLQGRTATIYRCPACASRYANDEWQSEALPHIKTEFEELVYEGYRHNRQTLAHVTPAELGEIFLTFKPHIEQLEARYQAELAGKRRVS